MRLWQKLQASKHVDIWETSDERVLDTRPDGRRPDEPLPIRQAPPPVTRLNRKVLGILLAVTVGLGAWLLSGHGQNREPISAAAPPPSAAPPPEALVNLPTEYSKIPVVTAGMTPPPAPPPPGPVSSVAALPLHPMPKATPAPPQPVANKVQNVVPAAPKAKPQTWLFANIEGHKSLPPFPVPKDDTRFSIQAKATSLVPAATWAQPVAPTRVLYRSQVIPGLLLHEVNSDIPGPVRIMVTQDVRDRFGGQHVLIPQYATVLGALETRPVYGQTRLAVDLDGIELPDGTVIQLTKAKLGDRGGATGADATVNNHWGKVIVGAGISAVLSIGARGPFGNQAGFAPSLPQEFAGDVSQSLNRTGQQVVRRATEVPPTLTVEAGTPVTIQLSEHLSFQQPAILTAR